MSKIMVIATLRLNDESMAMMAEFGKVVNVESMT